MRARTMMVMRKVNRYKVPLDISLYCRELVIQCSDRGSDIDDRAKQELVALDMFSQRAQAARKPTFDHYLNHHSCSQGCWPWAPGYSIASTTTPLRYLSSTCEANPAVPITWGN